MYKMLKQKLDKERKRNMKKLLDKNPDDTVKQETSTEIIPEENVSVDESKTAVGFINLILRIINEAEAYWEELVKKYGEKYKGLNKETVVFTIIDSISDILRMYDIYEHTFGFHIGGAPGFADMVKYHRNENEVIKFDDNSHQKYYTLFTTDCFGFYDSGPIMSVTGFIDNIVYHTYYLKKCGYTDDMIVEAYKIIMTHEMGHVIDRFRYLNDYPYYEMSTKLSEDYKESDKKLDEYYEIKADERPLFLEFYHTQIPAEKRANEYVGITIDDIKFSEGWGMEYFKRK